ncbi:alpha/beta-hydrolase [Gloeopeniophorella convolvens]|nr:alpha/beta-hydrolase [Gloeopeniophorella convolvens]
MHKETWEPTLRHLLRDAEQGGRYQIDEVWAIDVVQQGDSGLLNAEALGALFIWTDHARDILNFVLNYLPEEIAPDDELPAHLPRVAPEVAEARAQRGFSSRKLVVVGHSVSGCCGVLALHSTPAPFAGLVLVDPVIHPVELDTAPGVRSYILGAVSRRDVWPSRAEAHALMRKSPFFGAWDPEVLQAYVDYALAEDADGQVRLKCTGIQEATIFADGLRSQEAWCALPHVDARIPIKWVMPPPPASVNKTEEIAQELVWRRAENASNVQIPTASHLTVQDSPKEVAEELDEFLARNFAVLKSSL